MRKYHKVREYMRRSPVKQDRSPAFYAMTEALCRETKALRQKRIIRVKAGSERVPA